jgi:hypothetical protein
MSRVFEGKGLHDQADTSGSSEVAAMGSRWRLTACLVLPLAFTAIATVSLAQASTQGPAYDPGEVFRPTSSEDCENLTRLWQARLETLGRECEECRVREQEHCRTECSKYETDPRQFAGCLAQFTNPDHGPDAWGAGGCGSYHSLYKACDEVGNRLRCAQVRMERACQNCRQQLADFQKYQRWRATEESKKAGAGSQAQADTAMADELQDKLLNSWRKRGEEESQGVPAALQDPSHAESNEIFRTVEGAGERKSDWDLMSGLPKSIEPGAIMGEKVVSSIQDKAHNELVGSSHQTLDYLNNAINSMDAADAKGFPPNQPVSDYRPRVRPAEGAKGTTASGEDGPSFDEIISRNRGRATSADDRGRDGSEGTDGVAGPQGAPSENSANSRGAVAGSQISGNAASGKESDTTTAKTATRIERYLSSAPKGATEEQVGPGVPAVGNVAGALLAGVNAYKIQGTSADGRHVTLSAVNRPCLQVTLQILSANGSSVVARKLLRLAGGTGSFALMDLGLEGWDPSRVRIERCVPCEGARPDWLK